MIISATAKQSGFGTYPHKTVSHLTVEEKSTARVGGLVAYDCGRLSGGNHGVTWRVVRFMSNRFVPRVPSAEELEQIVDALWLKTDYCSRCGQEYYLVGGDDSGICIDCKD